VSEREKWAVPLNVVATKVTKLGDQLISVGGGVRSWTDSPENGAHGVAFRLFVTLLFPKRAVHVLRQWSESAGRPSVT
jgi:phosphoribosylformimino-5-aminoimidazole carboxamide ribonucleotide (ProFAR) isomerase